MSILAFLALSTESLTSQAQDRQESLTVSNILVRTEKDKELYFAASEYRVYLIESLRQSGYQVLGAENPLFGQDKSAQARYWLGGTVTDTSCEVDPNWPSLCEMTLTWELFDTTSQTVVYRVETRGVGQLRNKDDSVKLIRRCLASLAKRPEFNRRLERQQDTRASSSSHELASFRACPAHLSLPMDTAKAQDATVLVRVGAGHGSGVLVSPDGVLLTANHVVEALSSATVELRDGRKLPAKVLRRDAKLDAALLLINAVDTPCVPIATGLPATGQTVFAIGTPLSEELSFSVSRGLVSGIRDYEGGRWVQTDAALNPGNSGGPLLDETGAVVGLVSRGLASLGAEGVSFAISAASALAVLNVGPASVTTLRSAPENESPPQASFYVDTADLPYRDTPRAKALKREAKLSSARASLYFASGVLLATGGIAFAVAAATTSESSRSPAGWVLGGVCGGLGIAGFVITPIALRKPQSPAGQSSAWQPGLSVTFDF